MSRIDTLRDELGGPHPAAAKKVKDHLDALQQAFIENCPFAVMASSNAQGDCDASPKGGKPGFIKVLDDHTLLIPDVGGNRLFQTYQNFESNPKAGLVFMIPGVSVTVRVNGRIRVMDADEVARHGVAPEVNHADDNASMIQGLELSIDEAYFHCARCITFAELWDTEVIDENSRKSLKDMLAASH